MTAFAVFLFRFLYRSLIKLNVFRAASWLRVLAHPLLGVPWDSRERIETMRRIHVGLLIVLGLALVTLAGFSAIPLGWMTNWKVTGKLRANNDE